MKLLAVTLVLTTTILSGWQSSSPCLFVGAQDTSGVTEAPVSTADELCLAESSSLNTDPAVASATQALLTTTKDDVLANFTSFCSIFQRRCTVDLSQYSSGLQEACQAASVETSADDGTSTSSQGQFYDYQIQIDCRTNTVAPDAIEIPGSVRLENVPTCIGSTCDPNNLPPQMTDLLDQLLTTLTDEINAQLGESVVCQSGVSDGSGANGNAFGAPMKMMMTTTTAWAVAIAAVAAVQLAL